MQAASCQMIRLGLLDDKNSSLWNYLQGGHTINLDKASVEEYSVYSEGDTSTIFIPSIVNVASFTHELLHILIKTKGVVIRGCLKNSTRGDKVICRIFSDVLIDHISNCLEHLKIYPEFLKIGYEAEDFILDYTTNKLTIDDVKLLENTISKRSFLSKIYNSRAIDCFIGGFFSANACQNSGIDYTESLQMLKKVDKNLYLILETFLLAWESFDIDKQDTLNSYRNMVLDFVAKVKMWALNKRII